MLKNDNFYENIKKKIINTGYYDDADVHTIKKRTNKFLMFL